MSKFNWDRVRLENYSRRGGSEYLRKERESYYTSDKTAVATCHDIAHGCKSSDSNIPIVKKATPPDGTAVCPHCSASIEKGRLGEHLVDVHKAPRPSTEWVEPKDTRIQKADAPRKVVAPRDTQPDPGLIMPTPFSDKILRDWFFGAFPPDILPFDGVATMGSTPFDAVELDDFFYDSGLAVYIPGEETEMLVVGREEWREEDLEDLLNKRAGKVLKVYSQEMFLAYWAGGRDPFDEEDVTRKFGEGHPALEFLSSAGFDWPTTFVSPGGGDFKEELPSVGVLKHSGYTVGKSGLEERERREVLRHVFTSQLPAVVSASYMEQWGGPKSKARLQKMANSIAAFCRNEKKKPHHSHLAVSDWEDDLSWLKKTFYSGRFTFQWPSTSVR